MPLLLGEIARRHARWRPRVLLVAREFAEVQKSLLRERWTLGREVGREGGCRIVSSS